MWNKLSPSILGGHEEEEESQDNLLYDSERLCSLSHLQRLYAFAACFVAGFVCMILSMIVFINPVKFAVLFTFGNMLAIGSTAFLIGPAQQIRMMFDPVRMYATAIYVGCVVLALICALGWDGAVVGPTKKSFSFLPVFQPLLAAMIGLIRKKYYCKDLMIHSKVLTIIAIICEICALIWYSLSYIPFARRVVSEVTIRLFDTEI